MVSPLEESNGITAFNAAAKKCTSNCGLGCGPTLLSRISPTKSKLVRTPFARIASSC
jgi:hypothetical protein